jgi:hypothetical protein
LLRASRPARRLLRADRDPAAVLHLLDAHQVVAVVRRPVEAQLALDRVDAVGLDPVADLLVVEAVAALDARLEDLPRRERRGGLRLDRVSGMPAFAARSWYRSMNSFAPARC